MAVAESTIRRPLPFDAGRLDALLDDAGIDVLIATSKHNVQYLLGGYRFFFFETMDAIGTTRYLPALVYRKGKPESAAYVGCAMETFEQELGRFWPPNLDLGTTGSVAAMQQAVAHIRTLGDGVRRIGVEVRLSAGRRGRRCCAASLPTARSSMRCSRWSGCGRARRRRRSASCGRRRSASSTPCWPPSAR